MVDRVGNARQALSINISQRRPRKIFGIVRIIIPARAGAFSLGWEKMRVSLLDASPFFFSLPVSTCIRILASRRLFRVSDSRTRRSFP
jgi:hypothetical protein